MADAAAACAPVVQLVELLASEVAKLSAAGTSDDELRGLAGTRELTTYIHGDLHCSNVLVDVQGSLWLIDFANSERSGVFVDAAKMISVVLFEYFPLPMPYDEVSTHVREEGTRTRVSTAVCRCHVSHLHLHLARDVTLSVLPTSLAGAICER